MQSQIDLELRRFRSVDADTQCKQALTSIITYCVVSYIKRLENSSALRKCYTNLLTESCDGGHDRPSHLFEASHYGTLIKSPQAASASYSSV